VRGASRDNERIAVRWDAMFDAWILPED